MAATIEISYFNSFWIKTVNNQSAQPVWPSGYPYNTGNPIVGSNGVELDDFPGTGAYNGAVDEISAGVNDYQINWFVEESRIRGGYNNTQVDLGVKAYIVEEEDIQQNRFNSMIYSGIYNSRTGINNTNQFSVGQDIIKSVDPAYGSIQKLFAENTNMTIFQESKVSSALIDKDAVYTAEGSPMQTTSNVVIGQIQQYLGEYGISRNPESFAYYGFQKYFVDKDRAAVLRLSRDGITEISQYGMLDYFRDNLANINEDYGWNYQIGPGASSSSARVINCGLTNIDKILLGMSLNVNGTFSGYVIDKTSNEVTIDRDVATIGLTDVVFLSSTAPSKALGAYDIHNKNYVLSLQYGPEYTFEPYDSYVDTEKYNTIVFDELINGWSSFMSYYPTQMFSLKNSFYSIKGPSIWQHYSNLVNRGNFYNTDNQSTITFVFNQDSGINKVFQTVNYEGDSGWQVDYFLSGATGYDSVNGTWQQFQDQIQTVESYYEGVYSSNGIQYRSGFDRKENKYYANLVNTSTAKPGEIVFGESISGIKGRFATVKFSTDLTTDPGGSKELWSVGAKVNYIR
jgi:hypothetical protein